MGRTSTFGNLPPKVVDLFKRSLLVVRTQIDNGGAIIAANDSDIMQFARDTYSYMWPRDGALVANALDMAGFSDLARWFYTFCKDSHHRRRLLPPQVQPRRLTRHRRGTRGCSREAACCRSRKTKPRSSSGRCGGTTSATATSNTCPPAVGRSVVQKAADFMVRYRDPVTGLPLPSYDLWEERWGIHAFTVATVYGGLKAARNFAVCFGDREKGRASTTAPPKK